MNDQNFTIDISELDKLSFADLDALHKQIRRVELFEGLSWREANVMESIISKEINNRIKNIFKIHQS